MDTPTWKAILKKGVLPHIKTPEEYERQSILGMTAAAEWLLEGKQKPPTLATAKKIHALAFQNVVPFAGKPTKTSLITNGYVTSDPQCIPNEFELLQRQLKNGLPANANLQETCRWTAFAAARWMRIHPFLDGNKRTVALWTMAQLVEHIQPQERAVFLQLRTSFKELRKGNLKPFGETLYKACGGKIPAGTELDWTCPHRVAPVMLDTPHI